jgi:hypothetical protein
MKSLFFIYSILILISCNTTINLAVPTKFKEQATELSVNGSKRNVMKFGEFSTSRIKRGIHVSSDGPRRIFFLENLFLNQVGLQKLDDVEKEKASFRFSLSDGKETLNVVGKERELKKSVGLKILGERGIFSEYQRLQEYRYIFSALITQDVDTANKSWELLMSNIYERKKDTVNSLFTIIKQDDNGLATNGKDTIYIKGVMLKKTEGPNGKQGNMPIKMLGGYQLSTSDGVIAIIDIIDANVWFYNELNAKERLTIAAIATAIFARRVNNSAW